MNDNLYDVVIIGAGPAGLTAGVYTGRNRLKTLIISGDLGGQTAVSGPLENYPSYPTITGFELITKIKAQAELSETIEIKTGLQIEKITPAENGLYRLSDSSGDSYQAKAVIIAAGKQPKKLGLPNEDKLIGKGVSYCATCDGPLYRGKKVAVIGDGYAASEAALMLAGYCESVTVLMLADKIRGENITIEKIKTKPNIHLLPGVKVTDILESEQGRVGKIKYTDKDNKTIELIVDGVFVEIGSTPNTAAFKDLLKLNALSEIIIDEKNQTNQAGIYAAGDVTNIFAKQTVVAAGEGAKAAMATAEYLSTM